MIFWYLFQLVYFKEYQITVSVIVKAKNEEELFTFLTSSS